MELIEALLVTRDTKQLVTRGWCAGGALRRLRGAGGLLPLHPGVYLAQQQRGGARQPLRLHREPAQ